MGLIVGLTVLLQMGQVAEAAILDPHSGLVGWWMGLKGESVVKRTKRDKFCRGSVSVDFEEWDLVDASSVDSVDKWDREERKREAAKPLFLVRYE